MARKYSLAAIALCVGSVSAFAPMGAPSRTATSLHAEAGEGNNGKRFAAAALASAYLLGGLLSADAALAAPTADFGDMGGSSTVIAGRSGGRAGGRSRAMPRASAARPAPSRTVIQKTTVVRPGPAVVVAPPMGGYGYGGGYGGGFGGPGIGTYMMLDAIGDGMREGRQNAEIRDTRRELENERYKEMEMEQRLRMLEQQQFRGAPPPMMQAAPAPAQQ
uniref:Uncharacterized protein n=1 Tax=Minutocellus polymorphus TaxID=265543 RepID=A0A6U4GMW9_9STRA|mmetsp:Transcript_210/g.393  ORF Transcript_210/g.393 Transcript_210/m.393 type:complete len:219 (+) Transcript_210:71-727(+)|eukprot:CAMPEP_0181046922 /NCGR_PEP_ID=MMETSP1070-20121207/14600_1 /TAXON_ID=265543 /ORGANISM="Minutocellus polymorphus, Strain NH13" /LENGTH=218 /DNA_ID=CAMNT_0023125551 /DNA_START=33 /DNA_END=689 /DNA_ORIENTATION=-